MAGLAINVQSQPTNEPWGSLAIGTLTVTGTIIPVVLGPVLASGVNTITVPSGASGFVFTPNTGNVNDLTLKGVSGDTGISLPKATFSMYMFDPAAVPATIVIQAAGTVGLSQIVFF